MASDDNVSCEDVLDFNEHNMVHFGWEPSCEENTIEGERVSTCIEGDVEVDDLN